MGRSNIIEASLYYNIFFTKSRTEFAANTTSLNAIASAATVGLKNPPAAMGIAIML